jgi:hypothetical protein
VSPTDRVVQLAAITREIETLHLGAPDPLPELFPAIQKVGDLETLCL